jgi:glutamine amidotransferase-like uncharacterized protein
MKSLHPLALMATLVSWIGTLSTADLAHLAAAFSGVCAGIYYAAQAAAFIRDKFMHPRRR